MNKIRNLFLLMLLNPLSLSADNECWARDVGKALVTISALSSTLIVGALVSSKLYEFARKKYLLSHSLDELIARAMKDSSLVRSAIDRYASIDDEEIVSEIRKTFYGELFPLYFANELFNRMERDIQLDLDLLAQKNASTVENYEFIKDLINELRKLIELLKKLQCSISSSYDHRIEKEERFSLHFHISNNYTNIHHRTCS